MLADCPRSVASSKHRASCRVFEARSGQGSGMAEESAAGSSPESAATYEPVGDRRRPSFQRHVLRLAAGLWTPVVVYVAWRTAFSGFSTGSGHLTEGHGHDAVYTVLVVVCWFVYSLAMLAFSVSALLAVFSSASKIYYATGLLTIAGCLSLAMWGLVRLLRIGSFSAQWPWMIAWLGALGIQIGLLYLWERATEVTSSATQRGDVVSSDEKALYSQRVFGSPGGGLRSVDTYGKKVAAIGSYGERVTATLLEDGLADIPEARIFHQLRFPGSENADVDHAVVIGDTVILVDAKVWKPGVYTWSRYGSVLRDGQEFPGGDNHMAAAVAGYEDLMPSSTRVVALLVFIPRTEQKSATIPDEPAWHDDTVALTTPATLIDTIKGLIDGDRRIDYRIVSTLYENLM